MMKTLYQADKKPATSRGTTQPLLWRSIARKESMKHLTGRAERTLWALRRGFHTAGGTQRIGGYQALSQAIGRWEQKGYLFARKWINLNGGGRVMAYKLLKEPKKGCK